MADDTDPSSSEHLKGSVKEAIGKLTGDSRIEAEGERQKREATPREAKTSGPRRASGKAGTARR